MELLDYKGIKERFDKYRKISQNMLINGSTYFGDLERFIRNDHQLIFSYVKYSIISSGCNNVIMSGEIGEKAKEYLHEYNNDDVLNDVNLYLLPGNIRENISEDIINNLSKLIPKNNYIFIDDVLFYGKTHETIKRIINNTNSILVNVFVFFDTGKTPKENITSVNRSFR